MREIFAIIAELHESGVTILLVEQNASLALQHADRGYVLDAGRLTIAGRRVEQQVGVLEGEARVLLDQQDRHARRVQLADDREDLPHHCGASPRLGSSSSSRRGPAHQAPGDGQHLLFAAGEVPGQLVGAAPQAGEPGELASTSARICRWSERA